MKGLLEEAEEHADMQLQLMRTEKVSSQLQEQCSNQSKPALTQMIVEELKGVTTQHALSRDPFAGARGHSEGHIRSAHVQVMVRVV